jgi:hypothetical protein
VGFCKNCNKPLGSVKKKKKRQKIFLTSSGIISVSRKTLNLIVNQAVRYIVS